MPIKRHKIISDIDKAVGNVKDLHLMANSNLVVVILLFLSF